jgi:hypothetical protein
MRFGPTHGPTRRGIADLVDAHFTVPENPIVPGLTGLGTGVGDIVTLQNGLGDLASDLSTFAGDLTSGNFSQAFSDSVGGMPAWVWLTGGIIAYMFFFGGSPGHSRAYRAGRVARRVKSAAASEWAS